MALAQPQSHSSWRFEHSPMVLGDILSADTSVTVWRRDIDLSICQYFEQVFRSLGLGLRGVFHMDSLKAGLGELLPEHQARQTVINDIYLLADMLTCLFDCDEVGLRLVPLSSAMCPSFHTDNIAVRLVNTYLGPGTQWLPSEALHKSPVVGGHTNMHKTASGFYYAQDAIQQMDTFDVGLLKGSAWEQHEHMAALHRSCQVDSEQKRVLLTLDPM